MKTLKNLIKTALVAGAISLAGNFCTPAKTFAQDASQTSKEKLFPNLNFYFETGERINYVSYPEFKKYVQAWLSNKPKENKIGKIWFYYGDTNDDGTYDYVGVQNNVSSIKSQEKFSFNFDTKKINYVLEIYDNCPQEINKCDKIISKTYTGIEQKEAEQLGDDFFKRINEFAETQKEFSRFNSGQLEELVRKERYHGLKIVDGKLVGNSRIPIEKFFSEEEIKKVENYIREKPERERLKREQEEAKKIEYEKQEKIRIEQERIEKEARKPKARLKIGGSIGKASRYDGNLFFEINPSIKYGSMKLKSGNKEIKNKIGLDIMYSSLKFEHWPTREKIKYNTFGIGVNLGIISPSSKIEYDYLNGRLYYSISRNEIAYISGNGKYVDKELSLSLSQKLEFFPFKDSLKNLSFSLEAGLFHGDYVGISLEGRAGLKYTFGK